VRRLRGGRYRTRGCHFHRLRARARKRLGLSTRPFGPVPAPVAEPDESDTYVVLSFDGSFSSGSRLVFDDLTYTST
jgi:hypothetical protein